MSKELSLLVRVKGKLRQWKERYKKWREKKQLFLIYSMGKVGTTTVYSLLKKQHPQYPIIQVHFMSDHWVKEVLPTLDPEFHNNISIAEKAQALIADRPKHRLKIVTMVREPMVREISDIFQNWKGLLHVDNMSELTFSQLKNYLDQHNHDYVLNWFDTEFKSYLGFDIYAQPFDKNKGYSIYKTKKADILVIRTERMNDCVVEAIRKFCGLKIELTGSSNTIEQKDRKELYYELAKGYEAPVEKLKLLYTSKLVRHFYTDEEIEGFVKKWSHGKTNLKQLQS